ncbi:ATP:cob(I)alamin adenosyltransferase [Candidatus Micrarchaeota archaeon]|nr:ATP:cob(I)alamin adenosyltransferase [Candidatus Micrarchaeota archaeon]
MKLYTRGGDEGETSDYAGRRIPKNHWTIVLNGSIDSLQASLDFCKHYSPANSELIDFVQKKLWQTGGEVSLHGTGQKVNDFIVSEDVVSLEKWIDEQGVELKNFVRFSKEASLWFNEARVRCRELEVTMTPLYRQGTIRKEVFAFINRLSDLLFALAVKSEA